MNDTVCTTDAHIYMFMQSIYLYIKLLKSENFADYDDPYLKFKALQLFQIVKI